MDSQAARKDLRSKNLNLLARLDASCIQSSRFWRSGGARNGVCSLSDVTVNECDDSVPVAR